jgi:hypothetical protein
MPSCFFLSGMSTKMYFFLSSLVHAAYSVYLFVLDMITVIIGH